MTTRRRPACRGAPYVHSIAIQVPISHLTRKGRPTIGVWTSASRQRARVSADETTAGFVSGPFTQVSRLGNPLFNEVIVPLGDRDHWNRTRPVNDKQFVKYVAHPELAGLLPVLYPGAFPHLAALDKARTVRADLEAILLTGIPSGIIKGFTNFTGKVPADMLRLNTSIPPTPASSKKFSILGLIGGDPAGFPNGRRITDDVVTIELRAIAGATVPLVDPTYIVDAVDPDICPAALHRRRVHPGPRACRSWTPADLHSPAQIDTQLVTTAVPGSADAALQRRLIGPAGTASARNRPSSSASTAITLAPTRISTFACRAGISWPTRPRDELVLVTSRSMVWPPASKDSSRRCGMPRTSDISS